MPYILIRHKVEDYARWKPLFDQQAIARQATGCRGGQIFRTTNDPHELLILFEWDNLEKARQFAQSSDLREAMQHSGVIDRPDIYFLEKIEDVTV